MPHVGCTVEARESWNMTVLQPQTKEGRKTNMNHSNFSESTVDEVYPCLKLSFK